MGQDFPTCPARFVMDDPRLLAVLQLEAEAATQPLANWPEGYSAWAVSLLGDLKRARTTREQAMIEQSRSTPAPKR